MTIDRSDIIARLGEGGLRDLSGLDLTGADLSRLDLRGVDLSRADLTSADLRWTVLDGADLDAAVLRRADARWAVFRGAMLRGADLGRANLGWADLSGADLTGADLAGVNLENVQLAQTIMPSRSVPRWREAGQADGTAEQIDAAPRTLRLPVGGGVVFTAPSAARVAAAVSAVAALSWVWGWMFRRRYFDAFQLQDQGVVSFFDGANLQAGLTRVVPLEIVALLAGPVAVVGIALGVAVLVAFPLAVGHAAGELARGGTRNRARPLLLAALAGALLVVFATLVPPTLSWARDAAQQSGSSRGPLGVIAGVVTGGGVLAKLGFAAAVALALAVGWYALRLIASRNRRFGVPLSWRLRYPSLDGWLAFVRGCRFVHGQEALRPDEMRTAWRLLGALVVLLGFLLTGAGRVIAFDDMCDGGSLPRGQLYLNSSVPGADARLMCQRLVAETSTDYFAFFPSQTVEKAPGDAASREAIVTAVRKVANVLWISAAGGNDCPTCSTTQDVKSLHRTQVLIDPNEAETEGLVLVRTGDLVTLAAAEGAISSVRLGPNTSVTQGGLTVGSGAVQPGVRIRAVGRVASDAPILDARLVEVLPAPIVAAPPPLTVDLTAPSAVVISGTAFTPGNVVDVGLGPASATGPQVPLALGVVVGPGAAFSVAVSYAADMPVGPEWRVIARDAATSQYAVGPWFETPPSPTPTPPPSATPLVVEEPTPGAGAGTASGAVATNTPLPTPVVPGGGSGAGGAACTPDQYEPDWPRGFEKEIFMAFDAGAPAQERSFCGRGDRPRSDIDLAYFHVKRGRWYRVATADLAPGVDTVLAVGDLDVSTPCEPAGCWSDDRAALTFESEVVFRAVADGRAMVTVDNRGGALGTEATYKLRVVEFVPTPTTTPTPSPTGTITPTPSATRTPLPFIDLFEPNDRCSQAFTWLGLDRVYDATIAPKQDEDWFKTVQLPPGRYQIDMQPPEGQDYDVTLHEIVDQSKSDCPLLSGDGRTAGEGRLETVVFDVPEPAEGQAGVVEYAVRVFSRYPDVYWSEHRPYALVLRRLQWGTPSATPTPPPTETATATPTRTPSTPDGAVYPRPTVVATPTPPVAGSAAGGADRSRGRP